MNYPLNRLMKGALAASEASTNIQSPHALAGQVALAVMSLTVQHRVNVKLLNGLVSPCSLAFLSEGLSGERKSTLDALLTRGIARFECQRREANRGAEQRYKALLAIWSATHKRIVSHMADALMAGKPSDQLQKKLEHVLLNCPARPALPRLIVTDATPQALAARALQWPSMGLFADEGGVVFNSRSMSNLPLLSKFWDGKVPPVDRVSRASTPATWVRLTISLMVQPGVLKMYLRGKGESARASGYIARHLCSSPVSTQGYRFISDEELIWTAVEEFENLVFRILEESVMDPLPEPRVLELSATAQRLWIDFFNKVEGDLQAGRFLSDVKDAASKIAENAARVAAVLHEFAGKIGPIDADTMINAIEICSWYLFEFKRMFGEDAQFPPEVEDARSVEAWLRRLVSNTPGVTSVKETYLQQYITPHHLRRKHRLEPALALLCQQGKINGTILGKANVILLNPMHFSMGRM